VPGCGANRSACRQKVVNSALHLSPAHVSCTGVEVATRARACGADPAALGKRERVSRTKLAKITVMVRVILTVKSGVMTTSLKFEPGLNQGRTGVEPEPSKTVPNDQEGTIFEWSLDIMVNYC